MMGAGFEAVIGLEVHVQLLTRSKMFCACANAYGGAPNTRTCPVCLGLPGSLPVINREAVRMAIALGLAVRGTLRGRSTFYRKQYFYPDLPKGYQITQGPVAVVEGGRLAIPGDPRVRGGAGPIEVGIERAHLEEDAGKSTHEPGRTCVDLNRAGVPLLEIVGAPDLRSGQEAYDYLKAIHRLVTFLGICDGNLEEGSLRCDANVSVHRPGTPFGTRVEVKNINSFRYVRQALDYEIGRQIALAERDEAFPPETRGWDADRGETFSQRSKEAAMDYRYFPEPDLPALVVAPAEVEEVRATLPELPEARFDRFQAQYGLSEFEAATLLQSRVFADYYEAVAGAGHPRPAANWMLGEVSRTLNDRGLDIGTLGLPPAHLAELVALVEAGAITLKTAKEEVYPALLEGAGSPGAIVAARGLGQVSDAGAIEGLVRAVLAAHAGQVAQYHAGKANLRGFFVGQIMKAGKGQVNPQGVNDVLDRLLAEAKP
jgi:aspartyl-tRNA(Asn)/glutamyl-tRNA(Gln) amidotransferase subunit B